MTKNQRAALEDFWRVMNHHGITIHMTDCITLAVGNKNLLDSEFSSLTGHDIIELLEQEKEPTPELPGFEGTTDDLNNLGIRK